MAASTADPAAASRIAELEESLETCRAQADAASVAAEQSMRVRERRV